MRKFAPFCIECLPVCDAHVDVARGGAGNKEGG